MYCINYITVHIQYIIIVVYNIIPLTFVNIINDYSIGNSVCMDDLGHLTFMV